MNRHQWQAHAAKRGITVGGRLEWVVGGMVTDLHKPSACVADDARGDLGATVAQSVGGQLVDDERQNLTGVDLSGLRGPGLDLGGNGLGNFVGEHCGAQRRAQGVQIGECVDVSLPRVALYTGYGARGAGAWSRFGFPDSRPLPCPRFRCPDGRL